MKSAKESEEESIKAGDNDRLQRICNAHTKIRRKNNHTMFRMEDYLEVFTN
jgi:hypothetical protein